MFINVLSVPKFEMSGNKMQSFLRKDKIRKCLEKTLIEDKAIRVSVLEDEKELKRIALVIRKEKKIKIEGLYPNMVWDKVKREYNSYPLRTKKYYLYLDKQRQIFEVIDAKLINIRGNRCYIEYLQNQLEIEENKYE